MNKIIISGSSSGIGRAIAEKLLEKGCFIIGLARNHDKFNPDHPHYKTYPVNFSDIFSAEKILKDIQKDHPDINTVICNAGYGQFGCLEQFSLEQMTDMLNVNFLGQAILVKTFLPAFKRQKFGKIILMGSESALRGGKQGSIYCATKFAIRGFAESLRQECAPSGIAVTLINPGFVKTPFFDALNFAPGQAAENALAPADIADAVAHLIELENRYVIEEINLQPLKKSVIIKKSHEFREN